MQFIQYFFLRWGEREREKLKINTSFVDILLQKEINRDTLNVMN